MIHASPQINKTHVALGLSGGVDSAVAGYLLKKMGFSVTAIFLKIYEPNDLLTSHCPWQEDLAMAKKVAKKLHFPLEVWNFERIYQTTVLAYMKKELAEGRTPNPDTRCNQDIKFGCFLTSALQKGFTHIATGHYAQLSCRLKDQLIELRKSPDILKDQSYFLSQIPLTSLPHVLFPLSSLSKKQVRALAKKIQLPNAARPDSQGICFTGDVPYEKLVEELLPLRKGKIVNELGDVLGEHRGLPLYTIGQRHGIGIGGSSEPYYVANKITSTNTLVVVKGRDHALLYTSTFMVHNVRWHMLPSTKAFTCSIQVRYRQNPVPVTVTITKEGIMVTAQDPLWALTPGQVAVFYDDDLLMGVGTL